MPPSQLKQLKASLREHGVLGPQKSKKEKNRSAGKRSDAQKKLARHEALAGIRERFNPFELTAPARKAKFDVTSARTINGALPQGRPGVTRGLGEQRRRETLLTEVHRRNKVGGILDKRFGEDDPTLTPEQRAAERYARESERRLKKQSTFNLEDDEDEVQLTHGGREITFGDDMEQDDFDEADLEGPSEGESGDENGDGPRKRRRLSEDDVDIDGLSEASDTPERAKTKKEVMEEVIAKSKLHRYERQKAKEDDEALRAELDKGLPEFFDLMRQQPRRPEPVPTSNGDSTALMNPDRAALLLGKDRKTADEEYSERVRQMAMDQRSKPSERTKTEEERLEEEAARLRELEAQRLKRMRGEDDEDEVAEYEVDHPDDEAFDDADAFGLGQAAEAYATRPELDVEDEDEFVIDEDLINSDPDADISFSEDDESEGGEEQNEDDDEFIGDLALPDQTQAKTISLGIPSTNGLAFTYACPSTHAEFLETTKNVEAKDLPTVVQRIRALYHPKLDALNKSKLETFSKILVQHISYMVRRQGVPPADVIESLLRHTHSLAKSFPLAVGLAFREELTVMSDERPLSLEAADLVLLTGVVHIFPTSDHFHSVVTPSMLTLARYLAQSPVTSINDVAKGLFCVTLSLEYQKLSKRYIPEVILYLSNALLYLAPVELKNQASVVSFRPPLTTLRIQKPATVDQARLNFWDLFLPNKSPADEALKSRLLSTTLTLLQTSSDLWTTAPSFPEIFSPVIKIIAHLLTKPCTIRFSPTLTKYIKTIHASLCSHLTQTLSSRPPLTLHHHRPLAIKTSIPKFEETYNPDRHYDPDQSRAEISKLKAEHKRERKGALRELRKDANFLAREQLRDKKERDAEYEKKYRRLVAEIQSEEGREKNEYDKERRKRTGKW